MSEKDRVKMQQNEEFLEDIQIDFKAVIDGKVIRIEEINDPVFSSKMIGNGFGIIPTGKKLYAPIAGKIEEIASNKHAVYLSNVNNFKLLIHLGIDTIQLKGEGFESKIEKGMQVEAGDLLINFDPEFIRSSGLDPVVSVIILDQKEKEMDFVVYPTENAKANETLAGQATIYMK